MSKEKIQRERVKNNNVGEELRSKKVYQDSSKREEIESASDISLEDASKDEWRENMDKASNEIRTTCPFCSKRFDNEKHLKRHVAIHQRAHKCNMCRASFSNEENLEKHHESHSDNYYFECDICHLKYKRKITLKQHQVRAHTDTAAKFICHSCGQSFKVKVDLLVHIGRKHNTNVHICRYCGKSVKDLHGHEWKHKKRAEMASLKFSCHLCIEKFQSRTRLDNHLLRHKQGYKCSECNVVVTSSRQLKYHKEKKHKPGMTCPICKKTFTTRGHKFYQHVLTHAGIRPYNCDICGEDFTQRSSLFRHRKNHSGPLPPYASKVPIASLARNILLQKHY